MAGIRLGGLASGMDTDSMVKQMVEAKRTKVKTYNQQKTKNEWKTEALQKMNKDIATFLVDARKKLGLTNYSYNGKLYPNSIDKVTWGKKAESNSSAFTATAASGAPDGDIRVKVNQLASSASLTGNAITVDENEKVASGTVLKLQVNGEEKVVTFDKEMSMSDAIKKIKSDTGLNMSLGKVGKDASGKDTSMLFMSTKNTGSVQSISSSDQATTDFFARLGVDSSKLSAGVKGVDSKITVNGVEVTNNSNEVDINGINLSLKNVSAEESKVTVKTDVDAVYDKIKEFVDGYNKTISSMQDEVNKVSYRKYQPLSKEEREALSEEEVKLWDEKAKSGILKNNTALSSTISNVRTSLYEKVEGAGSMHELGITTGNWKTGAVLQIDEKKLKDDIAKDPQKVLDTLFKSPDDIASHSKSSAEGKAQRANTGVFVRVMEDMADGINAMAKQSGVGSESSIVQQVRGNILSGVIKNNSVLEKDISLLNKYIDDENEKINAYESSLYAQFAKMEKALQDMQRQSASFLTGQ